MTLPHEIQFPPEVNFLAEIPLLIFRPRGVLDEGSVNRVVRVLGDLEFSLKEPFNRFSDATGAEEVDLNFRYVIHVSLYRRLSYSGRPPIKSAILATDRTAIHYARMHALLTEGSPIKVRVFATREEAAEWLGVAVELISFSN
jgi:hypothetical protein